MNEYTDIAYFLRREDAVFCIQQLNEVSPEKTSHSLRVHGGWFIVVECVQP